MCERENEYLWIHKDGVSMSGSAFCIMRLLSLLLFGAINEKLNETGFGCEQEIFIAILAITIAILRNLLLNIFAQWMK
jgi:hypothetical protein